MKKSIQFLLTLLFISIFTNTNAASNGNTYDYFKLHADIQVAIDEMDIKKARSLVKTLLPILDSDIEYTKSIMEDEEDEYFLDQLTRKLNRQKEIRGKLEEFLKVKNTEKYLANESMNMIRELRRLSMKPKER